MTRVAEQVGARWNDLAKFANRDGDGAPWLATLRESGRKAFETLGFPAPNDEHWRHSHSKLSPLTKLSFAPADERDAGSAQAADLARQYSFGADAAVELVFVNGRYAPQLSRAAATSAGVTVTSLADAIARFPQLVSAHLAKEADATTNPFVALNTGLLGEGAFVHLANGAALEAPVHLLFISTAGAAPAMSQPRVLVVAENDAHATLVETYAGGKSGVYFVNAVTEVVVGERCRIDHCKLQQESPDAYHVASMNVRLGGRSQWISHSASMGAKVTRNDLNVVLDGEYADATVNGLVLVKDHQHADNHTLLRHEKANCPSHELYKHVLDGQASAVFKGKIYVQKGAQKTDSKQTSKSLLLSDDALMNSQPALEIYADDVKCTHGSTTGPVDEDMVFYLRTRGVGLDAARHLLTYAFAADITRRIKVEPVRRRLEDFMAAQHGLPQDLRITNLGAHDEKAR